jgi:hypothetical protein
VLRHVAFLELMSTAPETAVVHRGSQASFLTLRLLENWIALGEDLAMPESSAQQAARGAVDALSDDEELRASLGSVIDALVALREPDPQPVLPRVYALGKLYEQRGLMPQAADVYSTVARFVDSSVHLDLAYDAHMRHGFCLRNGRVRVGGPGVHHRGITRGSCAGPRARAHLAARPREERVCARQPPGGGAVAR